MRRTGRRRRGARGGRRSCCADFPGPVLFGLPSGHTTGPTLTLPFGVRARVVDDAAARADHRRIGRGVDLNGAHPPDRRLRHGHGHAGGDAEATRPRRPRLGPERLSADERLPAAAGHPDVPGLQARTHHRRSRPGRRRQRHLARQPGARGGARSQDPLLLAARGGPRPLPLGRALDRHCRHARQDHDDVADRLGAGARRRRSQRAHRRHRRELRRAATASAAGASS